MKIHVSEATAERLVGTTFVVKERGTVNVKVRCQALLPMSHVCVRRVKER